MALKFLYVGDIHESETSPSSRIDDFTQTRKKKRKEVLKIAKDNQVCAILQGGDFFDRPKVSITYLNDILADWGGNQQSVNNLLLNIKTGDANFKDLETQVKNVIPFVGIAGNHDLIGGAFESFDKTSLSVLCETGFFHLISQKNPLIFKDGEISVAITGTSYQAKVDDEDGQDYIVEKKLGDYHIHMAHGMLMDKSYGGKFNHTLIEDIAFKTEADLTINGHDHIGYELTTINNHMFVNPGALVRLSATNKEINRMPKVLLITVSKKEGIQVESIYLTCAEEGSKVLSRKHIEDKKDALKAKLRMDEIVENAKLNKGRNLNKIIENIGKTEGIDSAIIDDCTERITRMKEILEPEDNSIPESYIVSLELENFLAHKHSIFEFDKGINILTGKSRAGKSTVIRALRELLLCYLPNPRKAIFYNEEYFRITATLSNGYVITRCVENKKKGKSFNGYYVYDPNTEQVATYNTKALPEIQKLFKFQLMQLTDKKSINANFIMQNEGWFFTDNLSGQDRAKAVGYCYGTHIADAVGKEVNKESKDCNSLIKKNVVSLTIKENEIKSYDYLKELKEKLDKAKILEKQISVLKEQIDKSEKLLIKKENLEFQINSYQEIFQSISSVKDQIEEKLNEIKLESEKFIQYKEKWITRQNLFDYGKKLAIFNKQFGIVSDLEVKLTEIKLLQEKITDASNLLMKKEKTEEKIKIMEKLIESLQSVSEFDILQVKDQYTKLQELQTLFIKREHLLEEGKKLKVQYEDIKKKKENALNNFTKELKAVGTCPICGNHLDDDKIEKLIKNY